jgi:hypothetical protein
LGIGIAFTNNSQSAYVVANYYPQGNVLGQFAAEVPPLCTSTTNAGTTTSAGATTTAGITVTTQRSNNSAISAIQQRTHLSVGVAVLGSLFRLLLT